MSFRVGERIKMKSKYILYLGIVLLVAGLFFRYLTTLPEIGLALIIIGAFLKLAYILFTIKRGYYQPGREVFFLLLGLGLLFLGLWHKLNISHLVGYSMIISGVALKLVFIILFIRKTRTSRYFINP